MVASGKRTGPNLKTYYSSFLSLRPMRTIVFLNELNGIKIRNGDIISAYINACTTKNIFPTMGLSLVLLFMQITKTTL